MAILVRNTKEITAAGVKVLVYGQAGVGKTTLIKTLPNPIVLSAESGLLSLRGSDIPYIEIHSLKELGEAWKWLAEGDGKQYKTVCLDSISEIAEVVLNGDKKATKDPRQAYGSMADKMAEVVRGFRDLPGRNVYFSAKVEKTQTEGGAVMYAPSMPGNKITQNLPYFFDEVLALQVVSEDGVVVRRLQCQSDYTWLAKDRSGRLSMYEPPDLGALIQKMGGAVNGGTELGGTTE